MNEKIYIGKIARTRLDDVTFYNNVLELFTLSRKLKSKFPSTLMSDSTCSKISLMIGNFSEQFIHLPLCIAEAEVTEDPVKKIKANYSIKHKLSSILIMWSMIREQSTLPSEWQNQLELKMKNLQGSYKEWSALLTCSN